MPSQTTPDTPDVRRSILAVGQQIMAHKGFSGVGINEILTTAGVPKGSFYHYFGSKEAFGEALLSSYFETYLAEIDRTLARDDLNWAQRLMAYFEAWKNTQSVLDCQGKCLAVKLGAEVADLSEAMRQAMREGTQGIVTRLSAAIEAAQRERSVSSTGPASELAETLYQLWIGASILAKVERKPQPFDVALASTRRLLQTSDP